MIFEDEDAGAKKRRLGTEQVRALEQSFDVENRLDPDRKARLAQDLSLQPRQVAVWFQNRRARWKTKQLERDFASLKLRYDALRIDMDALRRDNQSLVAQIAGLKAKEGGFESDSSAVMTQDLFKVEEEEDWEETCGVRFFEDQHGSTMDWFSAEIAATL